MNAPGEAELQVKLQTQRDQFFHAVFMQHLGAELGELSYGKAEILLQTRPEHGNRNGTVHGGVIASIFDTVLSQAIRTMVGVETISVTIEFKINYLAAAKEGLLIARGEAISVGKSVATATGQVLCNDTVVAVGIGTFRIYRPQGDFERTAD